MHWETLDKNETVPIIAEEDITVFKAGTVIVWGENREKAFTEKYNIPFYEKAFMEKCNIPFFKKGEEQPLFSLKVKTIKVDLGHSCYMQYEIFEGYHSVKDKSYYNNFSGYGKSICEFIIPKGTKYCLNTVTGEIVSETIIFTGRSFKQL